MSDFFEQKADVQTRRKAIEMEISRLVHEIVDVDKKVRFYLTDRSQNPHPRHLDLIEKIQRYRIDPSVSNRPLEALLENLQWKIYYYQQSWRQLWENADAAAQGKRQSRDAAAQGVRTANSEKEAGKDVDSGRSQYSIDHLWNIQQEKLKTRGAVSGETKSDFKERISREYKALSGNKKIGQEIVMTFDPAEKRCRLDLKNK